MAHAHPSKLLARVSGSLVPSALSALLEASGRTEDGLFIKTGELCNGINE